MKFEKLGENKIQITLNLDDLKEKDIDLHSFMSNSIESQDLFLDMLDEAEKEVGFITKDYKIMIEALAMSNGTFIINVTRISPDIEGARKKKVSVKRKLSSMTSDILIYKFEHFDDFCLLCSYLDKKDLLQISKKNSLYIYQNKYYLIFNKINLDSKKLKSFYSGISEFANFVLNPDLFERKIIEYGSPIMKNNAIKICNKNFNLV